MAIQNQDIEQDDEDTSNGGETNTDDSDDESDASPAEPNSLIAVGKKYQEKQNNPTKNAPTVKEVLTKLLGSDSEKELAEAKAQRSQRQLFARLAHAGATIGQAFTPLAPNTVDDKFYKDLEQSANQPVQDLQSRNVLNMEKLKEKALIDKIDPNSPAAGLARQLAQQKAAKAGYTLDTDTVNNAPLGDLEKLNGSLSADSRQKAQIAARDKVITDQIAGRKDAAKVIATAQANADAAVIREAKAKLEDKQKKEQEKLVDKYTSAMGQDLDPSKARSGAMGDNQKRVNAAGRIDKLLEQFPDGNIPKIQTRELATAIGSLLSSGSQTSVTQVNELVPDTAKGKAEEIAQWFTGNPRGQQQQKFIQLYSDTAHREREEAQNQITQAQFKKAYSTHQKLKDLDPDSFYRNLSTATGLDTDDIKEMENTPGFKGQYTVKKQQKPDSTTSDASHEDSAAVAWAKANPNDPRAASILKINGL